MIPPVRLCFFHRAFYAPAYPPLPDLRRRRPRQRPICAAITASNPPEPDLRHRRPRQPPDLRTRRNHLRPARHHPCRRGWRQAGGSTRSARGLRRPAGAGSRRGAWDDMGAPPTMRPPAMLRWDAVARALAATTLLASAPAARRERGTGPSPPSCTTPSPFTGVTTGSLPRSLDVLIRSLPAMPLPHTTRAAVIRDTSLRPHGRTTAFSLRTIAEDRVLHVLPLWMRGPRAAPGWWCHGRRRSQLPRKTCSFFNPDSSCSTSHIWA
ncbi:hypothetical protein PVAP13_3NG109600 [Panicum virgatum]|uniref:Uncharacterized protein n=1 Tax=Panicum virgatum TaxID=38727 RepID=A0A8T0UGS7_PANVG|nr:hypothetical protein PVAP13_3NG109600 [Panicum virgatum]